MCQELYNTINCSKKLILNLESYGETQEKPFQHSKQDCGSCAELSQLTLNCPVDFHGLTNAKIVLTLSDSIGEIKALHFDRVNV